MKTRTWILCLLSLSMGGAAITSAAEERLVAVVEAQKAPLVSKLELSGSVTAQRDARLSARTSGLILDLKVDAGDVVKAGDVLMQLDPELAEIDLEAAIVERQTAELRLMDARRLNEEVRTLTASGAFAKSEARSRETAVSIAETVLKGAEVMEKQQRALVERHRLLAPFDGVIREKVAETGNGWRPGRRWWSWWKLGVCGWMCRFHRSLRKTFRLIRKYKFGWTHFPISRFRGVLP